MKTYCQQAIHYLNIFGFLWMAVISIIYFVSIPGWLKYGGHLLFFGTWLIEWVLDEKWKTWKWSKEKLWFLLLFIFFFWGFLYLPWDGEVYFRHHQELRLPMLAFAIAGLGGLNRFYDRRLVFSIMILTATCSVLFLFYKTGWDKLIYSPNRSYYLAWVRRKYINAHMGYNFYLNASLIGIWYMLFQNTQPRKWFHWVAYTCAAILIFTALMLSDGRVGFAVALLLMVILVTAELYKRFRWYAILPLGIGVLLSVWAISNHSRVDSANLKENNLRLCYWRSAAEMIQERPILGYGISNAQEEFDKVNMKYAPDYQRRYWIEERHRSVDSHNQFIQITMEFGIIGLLLLLCIYLSPILLTSGKARWLICLFTLMSIVQSMFDMFITSQFCTIYCLLITLCLTTTQDDKPIDSVLTT